ncbi:hypothetical protein EDC01DRAFT_719095 [Geopyxis carbonaria]|nr:hypothetical protein EDC01DRAFT_719095 [Geopyxis carbonaria]
MASVPALPHMDISAIQHSGHYPHAPHPHYATYAHLQPMAQGPPSPIISHSHLPPSPVAHPSTVQTPPSPDRSSSTDAKVMKHLLTQITKMQNTMKDLAERQEQILDRVSVLEQRVGRMDDGIGRILENTEIALEDSKSIRTRVEESER